MFLLDTNTLSDLFQAHEKIVARLNAVPDDRSVVSSTISRSEILEGRFASIIKAADRQALLIAVARLNHDEQKLSSIEILPITPAVADRFQALLNEKKHKKTGRKDLLIAAIALAHDATLVSRNTKDCERSPD